MLRCLAAIVPLFGSTDNNSGGSGRFGFVLTVFLLDVVVHIAIGSVLPPLRLRLSRTRHRAYGRPPRSAASRSGWLGLRTGRLLCD
ncbi:hypothetical protein [Methylomicrobium lacus]|uniref:hypothetical protein n=1 Tax=Methylomicrobium lacus TaxID=136992 RepID=UPI0035A9425E